MTITKKELRRHHRREVTHVVTLETMGVEHKMRVSRKPFREWARQTWKLDLAKLGESPSPALARILGLA